MRRTLIKEGLLNELSKDRIQLPRGLGGAFDKDPEKN
jgi:hypothetical protein